jgi:hypothetical protein
MLGALTRYVPQVDHLKLLRALRRRVLFRKRVDSRRAQPGTLPERKLGEYAQFLEV